MSVCYVCGQELHAEDCAGRHSIAVCAKNVSVLHERNKELTERVATLTAALESSRIQCAELARERDAARESERADVVEYLRQWAVFCVEQQHDFSARAVTLAIKRGVKGGAHVGAAERKRAADAKFIARFQTAEYFAAKKGE